MWGFLSVVGYRLVSVSGKGIHRDVCVCDRERDIGMSLCVCERETKIEWRGGP